ncbi:hypothetical protein AUJ14_00680 [Candidatus Micrarchaeota archaeon CG1_02_55_22]|nr:MAG: hypothetical protein AUJ14_00680 [Candidatus Micrarchaeota archaeon CG1_02_55_22]
MTSLGKLARKVEQTRLQTQPLVHKRMNELSNNPNWFSELCFCITTANYTSEGGMRIQNAVPDFSIYNETQIEALLRSHGYRFPRVRAKYLFEARKHKANLEELKAMGDSATRREWLAANVKGIGMKEASHFLRNVGYYDVAVIDRHILNVLAEHGILKKPKTLTPKKYLEIEDVLLELAEATGTSLGELDFYLWHMKTGKILK